MDLPAGASRQRTGYPSEKHSGFGPLIVTIKLFLKHRFLTLNISWKMWLSVKSLNSQLHREQ